MAGEEEDRVGMREARGMLFCQARTIGPNKKVEMAETLGDARTGEEEECQAVFAAGGMMRAVSPRILEQAVRATVIDEGDRFWDLYPDFRMPFQAGGLLGRALVWEEVFGEFGEILPGRLRTWLTIGYSVRVDKGTLRQPRAHQLSVEEQTWAVKHVAEVLVPCGAVEEIQKGDLPRGAMVCNVVVAYKEGQMSRFCWSGRCINKGVDDKKFRMESWREIGRLARPGDWAFSLDLEKGYLQWGLKEEFKNFCVFEVGGSLYRFRVMPFGLKAAPRDFSFAVKRVIALFRKQGIRCTFYIDDLLFLAETQGEALRVRGIVLGVLHRLGLRVSVKKSLLCPGQILQHLGFDICFRDCTLWIPQQKIMAFKDLAAQLLVARYRANGRLLARVIGKLGSFRVVCTGAITMTRGLMRSLDQLPREKRVRGRGGGGKEDWEWRDYSGEVELSPLAVAELRFWLASIQRLNGMRMKRAVQVVAFVDACPGGYGSVLAEVSRSRRSQQLQATELRGGRWTARFEAKSTHFELQNLVRMCMEHGEEYRGSRFHVCTDNVGAAFIAGKGCMGNSRLNALAIQLWAVCLQFDLAVSTQYLCGDGIIVSGADGLSRGEDVYDCQLGSRVFQQLWEWGGPFEIDCCASPGAIQRNPVSGQDLEAVSPYLPEAIYTDALTFTSHKRLYAFPPACLIGQLVAHVLESGLHMVMVVPRWQTQSWWAQVVGLAALSLGRVGEVVIPGFSGARHPFGRGFEEGMAIETELVAIAFPGQGY
jgi:hypothetical protein